MYLKSKACPHCDSFLTYGDPALAICSICGHTGDDIMADSYGGDFPGKGISTGHIHQHDAGVRSGGIYEYLGGDPTDIDNNWLLVGGKLSAQPDTSSWGVRQNGARWFNTTEGNFYGWNGEAIVYLG